VKCNDWCNRIGGAGVPPAVLRRVATRNRRRDAGATKIQREIDLALAPSYTERRPRHHTGGAICHL